MTVKTKNPKTQTASSAAPKDLKPTKDAKGGLLLPAVQKIREAAVRVGNP